MNLYFTESQKFNQWWLWAFLIGVTLIPIYGLYKQIYIGEQFGDNPLSIFGLILLLIFMIAFMAFFWVMQLSTAINEDSISIKFYPFFSKNIKWEDVTSAEVVNYGFVGGWGIRLGSKYGTVYNIRGNEGLALVLKNGKKLCVGTQKAEELAGAIKEVTSQQNL